MLDDHEGIETTPAAVFTVFDFEIILILLLSQLKYWI